MTYYNKQKLLFFLENIVRSHKYCLRKFVIVILAISSFFTLKTDRAKADTFIVNNTNNSGAGSLRQAIIDAENNPGEDTIVFDPMLSGQTITLTSQDANVAQITTGTCSGNAAPFLPRAALQITEDLIIDGSSAPRLIISGGWDGVERTTNVQGFRIFYLPSDATEPANRPNGLLPTPSGQQTLTITDLRLINGNAGPLGGGGDPDLPCDNGGAIYVDQGNLNITSQEFPIFLQVRGGLRAAFIYQ